MRRSSRCEGRWRVVHDGYSVQTSYAIDFHPVSESLVYIVTLSDQPLTSPRRHQDGELSNRNDRTRGVPAVPRGQKKSRTRTSWLRRLGVKSSEMAVEAHHHIPYLEVIARIVWFPSFPSVSSFYHFITQIQILHNSHINFKMTSNSQDDPTSGCYVVFFWVLSRMLEPSQEDRVHRDMWSSNMAWFHATRSTRLQDHVSC